MAGLAFGLILVVFGLSNAFAGATPEMRRMRAGGMRRDPTEDYDLIQGADNNPHGLLRAFVSSSKSERTDIARRLRQAGLNGKGALMGYYTVRAVLGVVLPSTVVAIMILPPDIKASIGIGRILPAPTWAVTLQLVTISAVLGFYGPSLWLRQKIRSRRRAIWESLPNALDLLQISVEAGLGFDAAMVRVSHELGAVAPEISEEFMMLQLEIQAGKERQTAFLDMAARTNIEEVTSFANVILQAAQFGTSVSSALNTYAEEMRIDRELKAQEKANRLPVQMSGVMALCMMPVLLMICLSPMLIRWVRMFAEV